MARMVPSTVVVDAWAEAVEEALQSHVAADKCQGRRCDLAAHLRELAAYLAAVADDGAPLPAADVEAWD